MVEYANALKYENFQRWQRYNFRLNTKQTLQFMEQPTEMIFQHGIPAHLDVQSGLCMTFFRTFGRITAVPGNHEIINASKSYKYELA